MTGYRRTVFRSCTLCEASCGLAFEVEGDRIVSVRADDDDVFSHGYICPKGVAIADVHDDPDRLRQPMRRTAAGEFEPIGWDEAFALVGAAARARSAPATAPTRSRSTAATRSSTTTAPCCCGRASLNALGTRNCTSAGSQDTSPRFAASYYLYGSSLVDPGRPTSTAPTTSSASAPTRRSRTAAS